MKSAIICVAKHCPDRGKHGADAPSSLKETGEALLPVLAEHWAYSPVRQACRTGLNFKYSIQVLMMGIIGTLNNNYSKLKS